MMSTDDIRYNLPDCRIAVKLCSQRLIIIARILIILIRVSVCNSVVRVVENILHGETSGVVIGSIDPEKVCATHVMKPVVNNGLCTCGPIPVIDDVSICGSRHYIATVVTNIGGCLP